MEKTISLLPFLESEAPRISLGFLADKEETGFEHSFPFLMPGKDKPFTRLVKADLKFNGSATSHSFFVLVQKDTYPSDSANLNPATNASLDNTWRDTIQFYAKSQGIFPVVDRQTLEPAQLSPLFYCKKRSQFFHPPCPACGQPLSLCKDEKILEDASLPSYQASLNRYLFCRTCHQSGREKVFYAYGRDSLDPFFVHDRFDLIRHFGQMDPSQARDLPCAGCPEHGACYTDGHKADVRLVPFSFYPFYMLVFKASQINGIDFLSMLSGAPVPPLVPETGSKARETEPARYLFKDDPCFWLELLVLKYAFLEKILSTLKRRKIEGMSSNVYLNVDSIWVSPRSEAGMMPFFWDYELEILDLVTGNPADMFQASLVGHQHINFIAQLWLYTFLVNSTQSADSVFQAAGELMQAPGLKGSPPDLEALLKSYPVFRPENIFWAPEPVPMAETWSDFWFQSLDFMRSVLTQTDTSDFGPFLDQCLAHARDMLQKTKSDLFSKGGRTDLRDAEPVEPVVPAQRLPENPPENQAASDKSRQAVAGILKDLRSRWAEESAVQEPLEEDVVETIVLSSSEDIKPAADFHEAPSQEVSPLTEDPVPEVRDPEPASDFEQMEDTAAFHHPDHGTAPTGDFEDMQETVILDVSQTRPEQAKPEPESDFEDLDETVIISPDALKPPQK